MDIGLLAIMVVGAFIAFIAGYLAGRSDADFENPQRFGEGGSNRSAPPHPARFSPNGTGQRG
jgi:hypothetical protein